LRAARALGARACAESCAADYGGDYGAVEVGTDLPVGLDCRGRLWLHRLARGAGQISKILFFLFLVLFIVILILAITAGEIIF
jgi:uncharacterized membrane protein YtjA (UPF0391 family)